MRERFLKGLVWFGAVLFLSTEGLSLFGAVSRIPLSVVWILAVGFAVFRLIRNPPVVRWPLFDPVVVLCVAASAGILALTGLTAAFSPPNSSDAMAYHMPRVVYWAEQSSVRFFPTQYFNQIMLQPFAEYLMLHTYVLTGDWLINFVQWFASAASIVAVSFAAGMFGSLPRGQALAALFCATIPSGILASSGAKNDYFLAMWLIVAVCFALQFRRSGGMADAAYLGAALGFALLAKGTAYLFAPWILVAILPRWGRASALHAELPLGASEAQNVTCESVGTSFFASERRAEARLAGRKPCPTLTDSNGRRFWAIVLTLGIALAINAPQYIRNFDLSGSPMGFDSAQGDGFFRWRNESFGWRQTASNMIRNTSDQLGARSQAWNDGVYRADVKLHQIIGIDINDPTTTWRWSTFTAPVNANHEANAPNRWHLAILVLLLFGMRDRQRAFYAAALIVAFVAFCGYLKWQPYFSRLLLPLFVLAAPLVGIVERWTQRGIVHIAFCLFLLDNARAPVLENWVRPLKGPNSVFHVSREAQYFSDLGQWHNRDSFLKAVAILKASECRTVGIDITNLQIEYPIEALLRARFVHTGVDNASSRYAQPVSEKPCAVVCLDCVGDARRMGLYGDWPKTEVVGRFLVFMR